MLKKKIHIPIYSCTLILIITDKLDEEIARLYKRKKKTLEPDTLEGLLVSFEISEYYLLIDQKYLTHNTISHEVYHAVKRITEPRDILEEESCAWLSGFLATNIYKFLSAKSIAVGHAKQ